MESGPLDQSLDPYFAAAMGGWLILQATALWRMRGRWRVAAWIPLAAMLLAIAIAVLGGLAGSNLAPIWVVLALPVCLIWLATLWILRAAAGLLARRN